MPWEGSLLTAQSISLGTHKSMTQNLIRKLLSLVSKNLPKKLGRAFKKKKKVCMFALNLGEEKIPPPSFSDLLFEVRVGLEWGVGEAGNDGTQGIRLCQGLEPGRFSFSPRGGKALTSLVTVHSPVLWCPLLTIQSPLSVVCMGWSLRGLGREVLPTDCLGEPDGQMSWSEARPFLFSVESHSSANGQPYSIRKNWVGPGLSSTLLSNLSFGK